MKTKKATTKKKSNNKKPVKPEGKILITFPGENTSIEIENITVIQLGFAIKTLQKEFMSQAVKALQPK